MFLAVYLKNLYKMSKCFALFILGVGGYCICLFDYYNGSNVQMGQNVPAYTPNNVGANVSRAESQLFDLSDPLFYFKI